MSFNRWKTLDHRSNISDKRFSKNFNIINRLYEHSLKNLIYILNEYHNLKEERRFWEILLGAWLSSFINQCHIEFIKNHKRFNKNIKIHSCYDYKEYNNLVNNDFFRYNLSKAIKSSKSNIEVISKDKKISNKFIFKRTLYRIFSFFFSLNYLINIPSNSFWVKYSCIPFLIYKNKPTKFKKYDYEQRDNIRKLFINKFKKTKFSNFYTNFYNLLPYYLPISYLEKFKILYEKYRNIRKFKKIISTHAHIVDDEFKFFLVNSINKKTKIYFYLHSGGYLFTKYLLFNKFEHNCCDKILYWGNFNHKKNKKVIPFYINRMLTFNKKQRNDITNINYIIFFKDFFRYSFSNTEYSPNDYFRVYKDLIKKLNYFLPKNKIIIRLYGDKIDLLNKDHALNYYYKKIKKIFLNHAYITFSDQNIVEQSNRAKLLIFTYCGTACLEMISLNFPSVIYIDKKLSNYYNKEFYKEMNYFKENNIFFDELSHMIKFIRKTDINEWWYSKANQIVVSRFRELFCKKMDQKNLYKKLIDV